MEKTDLQKQFEDEQDREAVADFSHGKIYLPAYGEWCERKALNLMDKATAYDRIMSGGKKTLKELANFLGKPITVDKSGAIFAHEFVPHTSFGDMWVSNFFDCMAIHPNLVSYTGNWQDSLTLPDRWEVEDGKE